MNINVLQIIGSYLYLLLENVLKNVNSVKIISEKIKNLKIIMIKMKMENIIKNMKHNQIHKHIQYIHVFKPMILILNFLYMEQMK